MSDSDDGTTTTEVATARVREAILRGEIAPGERLHQVSLAQQLGISRTPLRAALLALTHSGLVSYESNRGYRVREFSPTQIRDSVLVRAELEALACKLAATRISAEDLSELQSLVALGDRLLQGGTLRPESHAPYRDMNVRIHQLIQQAAHSPWIMDFVARLQNVPLSSDRIVLWEHWDIIHRSHDDHHRIVAALAAGDGERAASIMREHIIFAQEYLLRELNRTPDAYARRADDKDQQEDKT
ncbi:GntR family transcriptional regulator [Paracoccus xiamenensis]|uniref:GntR family transcriptional regulator n=1 Tax=Paracoccus xiamenensis TaxID=2714901 RepID=UPI00140A341F|nr:GntR family transcriptional regulator [Paracoccus xiamenensis]NHF74446.1 GntR family transcriptional regulator [Paracoccus xiamenensis]